MMTGASAPSLDAQNFLKVLSLIDRTILPRRLFLFNGAARLVLVAARQRASLVDVTAGKHVSSLESVAAAISRLCIAGHPLAYRLEPVSAGPSAAAGYPAIAIVNAQGPAAGQDDADDMKHYRFTKGGWPLAAPANASVASLAAAARIAWAMSGWQGLGNGKLEPPALVLAISDALPDDVSVSVDGGVTITSAPPTYLGQLVSRWRSRLGGEDA